MADPVTLNLPKNEEEAQVHARNSPGLKGSRQNKMSKHPLTVLLLPLFIIAAAAASVMIWNYYAIRESTDDAQIDGHIYPVAARVGGTVLAVYIDDNQYVKEGTLVVQLDQKDYKVALARAEADLVEAEASARAAGTQIPVTNTTTSNQVSAAQAMLIQAESAVAVAAKDIETARARLVLVQAREREAAAMSKKADQDLDRMKRLIVKDEISQQEYDAAVAAADTARAARDSAQAAVREAERSLEATEARLEQARSGVTEAQARLETARTGPQQTTIMRDRAASADAKIQVAKAAVDQAHLNLQYTSVRAPIGGVVSKKSVEVGMIVQPGQPLLSVIPLNDLWVTANYKESQLNKMRSGQPAVVSVDAYGGRKYKGHIDSIAAATGARFSLLPPENATGNYVKVVQRVPVKILFEQGEDPEHLLRPGLSVIPTVVTK